MNLLHRGGEGRRVGGIPLKMEISLLMRVPIGTLLVEDGEVPGRNLGAKEALEAVDSEVIVMRVLQEGVGGAGVEDGDEPPLAFYSMPWVS